MPKCLASMLVGLVVERLDKDSIFYEREASGLMHHIRHFEGLD